MPSTTGYEKRIAEAAPELSRSKCQRLALKLAKRAERMQTEFDFYAELRILGITTDTTARTADQRIETRALLNRMGVAV